MYLNICGGDFVIDYGNVRSTVKPEPIQFDEKSVWVNKNIKVVEEEEFSGWEYDMIQYTKDEYMEKQKSDIDYLSIMTGVEI
jgi:hypothetical protein